MPHAIINTIHAIFNKIYTIINYPILLLTIWRYYQPTQAIINYPILLLTIWEYDAIFNQLRLLSSRVMSLWPVIRQLPVVLPSVRIQFFAHWPHTIIFFQQSIPIFGMLPLQLRMKPSKSTTKHRKVSTQYLPALGYKGRQPSIGTTLVHAGKYFACPLISGCNKQWVYGKKALMSSWSFEIEYLPFKGC